MRQKQLSCHSASIYENVRTTCPNRIKCYGGFHWFWCDKINCNLITSSRKHGSRKHATQPSLVYQPKTNLLLWIQKKLAHSRWTMTHEIGIYWLNSCKQLKAANKSQLIHGKKNSENSGTNYSIGMWRIDSNTKKNSNFFAQNFQSKTVARCMEFGVCGWFKLCDSLQYDIVYEVRTWSCGLESCVDIYRPYWATHRHVKCT